MSFPKRLIILLCLGLFCLSSHGNIVAVPDQSIQGSTNLGEYLLFIEDESRSLTLDDILLNNHSKQWSRMSGSTPNFGYSQSNFWFKTKLYNNSNKSNQWILEIDYPMIDYIDITLISDLGHVREFKTGTAVPFDERPIKHRKFLFPLEAQPRESIELIVRIESSYAIQLPLTLWAQNSLLESDENVLLVHGLYFGLMAVMAFYNLFIFLFTKDKSYLFYVCFVVSITLFQATQQGLSFAYLWPNATVWHANSTPILIATSILFAMVFVDQFLDLRNSDRISHYFSTVIAIAATLLIAANTFAPPTAIMQMGILLAIPTCIGALLVGIKAWYNGNQQARYYIIAWAIFLVGTVVLGFNKFGWLPRMFITEYSSQIGSGLEVVLLALALADRINHERTATMDAQERALANEMFARELEEKAKERLERNVAERTRELSLALKKLSHANKALESLSTTDGLTQVKNRRFFNITIVEEWKRSMRGNYTLSLLLIDLDYFKSINDRFGHMVGDECLIQTAAVIEAQSRRTEDSVCRYGGEEFAVILPNIDSATAFSISEKIRKAIHDVTFCRDDTQFNLSASIGVATLIPNQNNSINNLITNADTALYNAKNSGRNRSVIFGTKEDNVA